MVTSADAIWTIGLFRSPAVQYMNSQGRIEERQPYFLSKYQDGLSAVSFTALLNVFDSDHNYTNMQVRNATDDFQYALNISIGFDNQISADALHYSQEYADLLTISTRQALSALEITLVQSTDGTWNSTDVKAFMKNMGSIGGSNGVSAVDVLYAAFPLYMYLDPDLGAYLLEPLLEYQASDLYSLPYAARNIGSAYPNATADGINQEHQLGVEESANMIIMTYAHAQTSGNSELISKHYDLLKEWTDYLVGNALMPSGQLSPDQLSLASSNMTNVALKGILGIAAMGKMSEYVGVKGDADNYTASMISFTIAMRLTAR